MSDLPCSEYYDANNNPRTVANTSSGGGAMVYIAGKPSVAAHIEGSSMAQKTVLLGMLCGPESAAHLIGMCMGVIGYNESPPSLNPPCSVPEGFTVPTDCQHPSQ